MIVKETKWTKRTVLKALASSFDPLGFLVPVNLPRKIFFQSLWKNNKTWDEEIESQKWNIIKEDKGVFQIGEQQLILKIQLKYTSLLMPIIFLYTS